MNEVCNLLKKWFVPSNMFGVTRNFLYSLFIACNNLGICLRNVGITVIPCNHWLVKPATCWSIDLFLPKWLALRGCQCVVFLENNSARGYLQYTTGPIRTELTEHNIDIWKIYQTYFLWTVFRGSSCQYVLFLENNSGRGYPS